MEAASGQGRGNAIVVMLMMLGVVMVAMKGALATNYRVGDEGGWTITSYDSWVAGKTFKEGDTLQFVYSSTHDVVEVTEANYGACSQGSNTVYRDGNTTYNLIVGSKYYICSVSNHCSQGMKVAITVVAADTTPTTPSTPPTTPSTTTPSPPNSSPLFIPPSIFSLFLILGLTLFYLHSS